MKLNPDCIRDILITVESATDSEKSLYYSKDELLFPMNKYEYNTVLYHIRQCYKAGLIDGLKEFDGGECGFIDDLSPYGHQFLADIRSESVWNKVKEISKKVGSSSLSALTQIATGVISSLIQSQFLQ